MQSRLREGGGGVGLAGGWGGGRAGGGGEQSQKPKRAQELCESRGGRPGLSVLTSFTVSVDVKLY